MISTDTKSAPYGLIYGLAYLGLDLLYQRLRPYLEFDSSLLAYSGCLLGAALFAGGCFQKRHRRAFSREEARRVTRLAVLVTSLITLADTLMIIGDVFGLAAFKAPLATFQRNIEYPALLAVVVFGYLLFTYGLLRFSFGYLSTRCFAVVIRKGFYSVPAGSD